MRGKLWSIEEERQLRELVSQGLGITEISQVMGKPRLCVKGKVYNLGLSLVVAAGSQHKVAATAARALFYEWDFAEFFDFGNPTSIFQ